MSVTQQISSRVQEVVDSRPARPTTSLGERTQQLWRRRFQQIGVAADPTPEEVELERSVSDEPVPASALVALQGNILCPGLDELRRPVTIVTRLAPITQQEYDEAQEQLPAAQEAATKAMEEFKDRSAEYNKSLNEKLPNFAELQGNERGFHVATWNAFYNALRFWGDDSDLTELKEAAEKATDLTSFRNAIDAQEANRELKRVQNFQGHARELAEKCSALKIETVKLAIDAAIAFKAMQAAKIEKKEADDKVTTLKDVIRRFESLKAEENAEPREPKGIQKQ